MGVLGVNGNVNGEETGRGRMHYLCYEEAMFCFIMMIVVINIGAMLIVLPQRYISRSLGSFRNPCDVLRFVNTFLPHLREILCEIIIGTGKVNRDCSDT